MHSPSTRNPRTLGANRSYDHLLTASFDVVHSLCEVFDLLFELLVLLGACLDGFFDVVFGLFQPKLVNRALRLAQRQLT